MSDVSSPDDSDPNSLASRCERWVAATVNATAETASACPCDADSDASGQPAACVSLVAPSAQDADANAPAWWSSLFVTVLGVGFFALIVTMFRWYFWHHRSLRSELVMRRILELLDANGKPTYVVVLLPSGETAAAKRLPDNEQTPGPDGGPPAIAGEDDAPSVGLLLGIERGLRTASGAPLGAVDVVDEPSERRRRRMFQFAPAYATLNMERLFVSRLREEQAGRSDSMDRLRDAQVREQERIWRQIQATNERAREDGDAAPARASAPPPLDASGAPLVAARVGEAGP